MRKRIVGSILILLFFSYVPANRGQEKAVDSAHLYDAAMELYYQRKYEASREAFSRLIRSFPTSQSVSYSQYMIGQCYLGLEKFPEAMAQFGLYLKAYPDGYRAKDAEAGIHMAKEKLKANPSLLQPPPAVSDHPLPHIRKVKRRVCAQIFYLEEKTLEDVEKKVKELRKTGVDTLIVRVFQNKGDRLYKCVTPRHEEGVYFKTDHAPVVDDILGKLIDISHRNGLDLFAWMTTRYADFGSEENLNHRCKSYNFATKKMEVARGVTLFHPDVLKRLEGLFRDLGRYSIDGILFQDDLILKHNEDFSAEAGRAFLKEFGYSPHPDLFYVDPYKSATGKYYVKGYTDRFWVWVNWKNRWLMEVAGRLMAAARESNPNVKFAINLYYEAILNPLNGVAWFSQTLSEALNKGFDYYAIMAYHRQSMKEMNMDEKKAMRLMAEVAQKAIASVGDPSRVMMKLQILDWNSREIIPEAEIEVILKEIFNKGPVSLAFVPYVEQFPLHLLKSKWDNILDPSSSDDPVPKPK